MKILTSISLAICFGQILPISAKIHDNLGPPMHGEVIFNILKSNNQLQVLIKASSMDILGFENPPRTTEQINRFIRSLDSFKNTQQLFSLPQHAKCELINQRLVHSSTPNDKNLPSQNYEVYEAISQINRGQINHHSRFTVHYQFNCEAMEYLTQMFIHWFEPFPLSNTVNVHMANSNGQKSQQSYRGNPLIRF